MGLTETATPSVPPHEAEAIMPNVLMLAREIFDDIYYFDQIMDKSCPPADLLGHYLTVGYMAGLDPSPYFSTKYYLDMAPDVQGAIKNPLLHFIRHGKAERRRYHPRFDIAYYSEQRPAAAGPEVNMLLDYLRHGRRLNIVPDPFFDATVAARRYPTARTAAECWRQYLLSDASGSDDPFPQPIAVRRFIERYPNMRSKAAILTKLFDTEYYLRQAGAMGMQIEPSEALTHYVHAGASTNADPHPLFSNSYYLENSSDLQQAEICPLLHYITFGYTERRRIHPLFADYRFDAVAEEAKPDLYHYLALSPDERPSPCQFFDASFYRRENPDVDWTRVDPICHYIEVGASQDRQPHALFDSEYYRKIQMRPANRDKTPLEDFVVRDLGESVRIFAMFDPGAYLRVYPDLQDAALDPTRHYLTYGNRELRSPNRIRSEKYIFNTQHQTSFYDRTVYEEYVSRRLNYRKRILFVGHEASRTGAPGILLGLVKYFSKLPHIECITIIDQDGPLTHEFEKYSHVYIPEHSRTRMWSGASTFTEMAEEIRSLLERLDDNMPLIAICNSSEARPYAQILKQQRLPIIFLVHEIADFYPVEDLLNIVESSDLIVFPAQFVADAMMQRCPLMPGQGIVLPQGLLRDTYGTLPQEGREHVFRDLPISNEDFVVTGCGTLDGRKGFDLFVSVARRVRARYTGSRPIKFLWVGGMQRWRHLDGAPYESVRYWASWEIKWNNLENMVFVTGEVTDTEPYLMHSDLFLLTSRADPFPCVVHEAMATALPVLCFENCGGAPEAVGPAGGIVLPYQDIDATADCIIGLAEDEPRCRAIGKAGRERVRSQYRFQDYAARIGNQIDAVLPTTTNLFSAPPAPRTSKGRIYFATPGWELSGVNTFTESLVNYLNANGYEAEIVFSPGRNVRKRFATESMSTPLVAYRFVQPVGNGPEAYRNAMREFLLENAPCVLVPNYDYVISELAPSLPPAIGIVGIAHADDREHYAHCYRLGPYWNRIVAVSSEIRNRIVEQNPAFNSKLAVIPYGLKPPCRAVVQNALQQKALHADPIRLVYAGRFQVFQKRIYDYVELVRSLSMAHVPFHLDLIGDGEEFNQVSRLLAPFIRTGMVTLPGKVEPDRVREIMLDAHGFVLFSDFEGLPLALIEAMQAGCIPIVWDIKSGIPEVIVDGQNGFIVPKGAWDQVTGHIRRLQQNPELRAQLALAAAQTGDGLTQEAMGAQYEGIFADILQDIESGVYRRPAPFIL